MSPLPVTLVFTQGSPVYEYSGGPFATGKDVIVTLKEGAATIFAPLSLALRNAYKPGHGHENPGGDRRRDAHGGF